MYAPVLTKDPAAVQKAVQAIHREMFPEGDTEFIPKAFRWAIECFEGRYRNFQPIDALYHDFEHTLQVTLCLARLLHGMHRHRASNKPDAKQFELVLLAILLHDTGYLKAQGDTKGTGAKYTLVHVARSVEFSKQFLKDKGYPNNEITSIGIMIRCTGVNADLSAIPFAAEWERTMGYALATADLLGQMAADDYIDKLPILFEEFAEAARHQTKDPKATGMFSSALDLMQKTPVFWEKYVLGKINGDFNGIHRYLGENQAEIDNWYVKRIEANIARLKERLSSQIACPA